MKATATKATTTKRTSKSPRRSTGVSRGRGCGLGLRRGLLPAFEAGWPAGIDLLELAPENWLDVGGAARRRLREITERGPVHAHGLGLNLGGLAPLDRNFLFELKTFLAEHQVGVYSDHLSFCADAGQLYELLPIPFTDEAVRHVAARIRRVQDLLARRIAVENVSLYGSPETGMSELEFLRAVLDEADCDLLLDVNNVYVNSINLGYDASAFIRGLPGERIVYGHIAGHLVRTPTLLIDTHAAMVAPPVWALLAEAYAAHGVFPTVLERDSKLPPVEALLAEVAQIRALQAAAG